MEAFETASAEEIANNIESGVFTQWIQSLIPKFWGFLWCLFLALIVFAIGTRIIKIILKLFKKGMDKQGFDSGTESFLSSLLKYFMYMLLFVVILGLFGITTTSISAAIAAVGLSAGLAFEGALSNLAGGVLILVNHPFKVGDYIKEGSGGNEGTVVSITIVYTTLLTIDGMTIVVPNGKLANSSLCNYTVNGMRMINDTVGISYDADIKKAKEIVNYIIENTKTRLPEEGTKIFVAELGESAVKIGYRFWVYTEDFWNTRWATNEEIKERFDKAGVEICYNQLDVHIDNK